MKKAVTSVLNLILALFWLANCAPALAAQQATLVLDIGYRANLRFSIYDADIYLDDTYVGTILQGEHSQFTIDDVETGVKHTLSFYKSLDHSLENGQNQYSFTLEGDSRISCSIHAHWYGLRIEDPSMTGAQPEEAVSSGLSAFKYRVRYESNLYFATYDIEMYIDDELVDTLSNGYTESGEVEIANGEHTVSFYKRGAHSIVNSVDISVSEDTVFECSLKSHQNYIDVKNLSTNAYVQ